MKKTDWKYLVDTLMFLCIVGIVFIGALMGFVLKEGPVKDETQKYFLGLHRHQWGDIHLCLALAFTAFLVIHLIFEWSWIKGKARRLFKKNWNFVLPLTLIASIAIVFFFWLFSPKYSENYAGYGTQSGVRTRVLPASKTQSQNTAKKEPANLAAEEEKESTQKKSYMKTHSPIMHEEHEENLVRGRLAEDSSVLLITGQMTLYDIEQKTGIPAKTIAEKLGLPSNVPLNDTIGRLRRRYGFSIQELRDVVSEMLKKSK